MFDLKKVRPTLKDLESLDYREFLDNDKLTEVVGMPQVVQTMKDGRLVNEVKFVETPLEELNKGLKVNDFAIEVLLANGYQTRPLYDSPTGLDDIDQIVDNIPSVES